MSAVRPLRREDLPQVVDLFREGLATSGALSRQDLVDTFDRLYLDNPWFDPDVPSLVYEHDDERILGFIGIGIRRLRFEDRPIRAAASGAWVISPELRGKGVGTKLLGAYVAGPQDVSLTDTASEGSSRIWRRVGGIVMQGASLTWLRPLRPSSFAGGLLVRRRERLAPLVRGVGSALDGALLTRLPGIALRDGQAPLQDEPLTPAAIAGTVEALAGGVRLRPEYDEDFLRWLFREMTQVPSRGRLHAALIRDGGGEVAGWYACYLWPNRRCQVVQVLARPRAEADVLAHLILRARDLGATAVQGRLQPQLFDALPRGTVLYPGNRLVVHSRHPELVAAVASGDALITGLEGDSWMHR